MINFQRLFFSKFIFSTLLPPMSDNFAIFFYVVFGLLLLMAIASKLMAIKQGKNKNLPLQKMWQKWTNYFLTFGVVGFLLLFFRQQKVYILSMPLLWYLSFIGATVWLVFIIKWIKIKMKKIQQEIEKKKQRQRYLP
jgi:uncharacterized protein YhhL (DUF1145 family)